MRLIDLLLDGLLTSSPVLGSNKSTPLAASTEVSLKSWIDSYQPRGHSVLDFPSTDLKSLVDLEKCYSTLSDSLLLFYAAVAYGSLSIAFILTQRSAAIRRIETSKNQNTGAWLQHFANPDHWITVGISHLTTSRQHATTPVVLATEEQPKLPTFSPPVASNPPRTWKLSGVVPWVTATRHSEAIVVGACDSQNPKLQYLFLVQTANPSIVRGPGMELLALSDSCTDEVVLSDVSVSEEFLLHGPIENVMTASQTSGAGGLQTSALALGLAARAIDWIQDQANKRKSLEIHADNLSNRWIQLVDELLLLARNQTANLNATSLREESNRLVLRSTQAAIAIGKGAGFLASHPVARWTKESMFFLVWSCPQGIADAHLCELTHFDL